MTLPNEVELGGAVCGFCGEPPQLFAGFTVLQLDVNGEPALIGFHDGACLERGLAVLRELGVVLPAANVSS